MVLRAQGPLLWTLASVVNTLPGETLGLGCMVAVLKERDHRMAPVSIYRIMTALSQIHNLLSPLDKKYYPSLTATAVPPLSQG